MKMGQSELLHIYPLNYLNLPLLLACIAVFLLLFSFIKQRRHVPANLPPGPWSLPALGCLPIIAVALCRYGFNPRRLFSGFADKYGKIFRLDIFGSIFVILNGYDEIKEAFRNPNLNDRPYPVILDDINLKPGIVFASGETWKQLRRFTLRTLRDFGVGKRSFEQQISTEAKALVNEFILQKTTGFNPQHIISNATSNVICSVIFGKRYEYSNEQFQQLLFMLNELATSFGPSGAQLFVPFARYLQPQKHGIVADNFKSLSVFINKIVDEHRSSHDPANPRDFIDVFLNETEVTPNEHDSSELTGETLITTMVNLFGAGSETTATTLRWCLVYMMIYPDIQYKIHQEIDNTVGRDRFPQLSDAPRLPYTEAALLEIQRINSIAPLGIMHCAANAASIKGFYIPKGAYLISNLWAVHNNPEIWDEPSEFRPNRFLDEFGNVQQREELIPFSTDIHYMQSAERKIRGLNHGKLTTIATTLNCSTGRRICVGENLAKMELFLFFTYMLHQFTITKSPDSSPLSVEGITGLVHAPHQFNITVTSRD